MNSSRGAAGCHTRSSHQRYWPQGLKAAVAVVVAVVVGVELSTAQHQGRVSEL
jgi:hypothetical protein